MGIGFRRIVSRVISNERQASPRWMAGMYPSSWRICDVWVSASRETRFISGPYTPSLSRDRMCTKQLKEERQISCLSLTFKALSIMPRWQTSLLQLSIESSKTYLYPKTIETMFTQKKILIIQHSFKIKRRILTWLIVYPTKIRSIQHVHR